MSDYTPPEVPPTGVESDVLGPPPIGTIVLYRTDGRNGLVYDLPAIVTCTEASHPGDYPTGQTNPLPIPSGTSVHLTVFTPGGVGTKVVTVTEEHAVAEDPGDDYQRFVGAPAIKPGSGTYVELNVPMSSSPEEPLNRTWRFMGGG